MNRSLFYLQAPVGNHSYFGKSDRQTAGLSAIEGWSALWFRSGTMSLAAAVAVTLEPFGDEQTKVLVPGYGCPDLVSALRFCGAEPVFCDLLPDSTRLDPALVDQHLKTDRAIKAIIGVDLFGIAEDWKSLRTIADRHQVALIQDFAQSVQTEDVLKESLVGDAAILSFGRGKPVCCLGGGALLLPSNADAARINGQWGGLGTSGTRRIGSMRVKRAVYNFSLRPLVYAQLARILGDRIGCTRYIPLQSVFRLPDAEAQYIERAVEQHWSHHQDKTARLLDLIEHQIPGDGLPSFRFPKNLHADIQARALLRLPILVAHSDSRQHLIRGLRFNGISATTMYSRPLTTIVNEYDGHSRYRALPNAEGFAKQLVTLPVHSRLTESDMRRMAQTVAEYCS
ncbi:MAG: DegT/DnrJ/EryC1/StrS family aminotransferase [Pseudomonadota bacterium]